jgi:hypothetical protein
MSIRARIFRFAIYAMLERPARKNSYDQLITALETNDHEILSRFKAKADTSKTREKLAHIIGIERWAQRRLQTVLGSPLLDDEHDGYCPAAHDDFTALCRAFQATRQESILLARRMEAVGISKATRVRHNQFGEIAVDAWLRYIVMHASTESKLVR